MSKEVSFKRKEWTTSMTCWVASSAPSSPPSSAEGLAPMSTLRSGYHLLKFDFKPTNVVATNGDLLAVGLVCDTVDFLEVVRVGEDLVAGDNVLSRNQGAAYLC